MPRRSALMTRPDSTPDPRLGPARQPTGSRAGSCPSLVLRLDLSHRPCRWRGLVACLPLRSFRRPTRWPRRPWSPREPRRAPARRIRPGCHRLSGRSSQRPNSSRPNSIRRPNRSRPVVRCWPVARCARRGPRRQRGPMLRRRQQLSRRCRLSGRRSLGRLPQKCGQCRFSSLLRPKRPRRPRHPRRRRRRRSRGPNVARSGSRQGGQMATLPCRWPCRWRRRRRQFVGVRHGHRWPCHRRRKGTTPGSWTSPRRTASPTRCSRCRPCRHWHRLRRAWWIRAPGLDRYPGHWTAGSLPHRAHR